MFRSYIVALVLMLGLSGGLQAQDRQQPRGNDDGGWVAMLLQMRQQLRLSPEQITKLREIDQRTEELNRPYVMALHRIRGQVRALGTAGQRTPEQNAQFEALLAEGRPHIDKIWENNLAAIREARHQVLSSWQVERLDRIFGNQSPNRERSGNNQPSRGRGQ